jgi:glycine oxidase
MSAALAPLCRISLRPAPVNAALLPADELAYNNRMASHPDVVIIGGGIIGLTTAYFLAREGVRSQVVDRGDLGQEASWAGAGILPPGNPAAARTPFEQLRARSIALMPALSAELRERTGVDNGYLECGGLEILDEGEDAAITEWRCEGIRLALVEGAELRRLEPALAAEFAKACYLPELAQVRNPRHLKALIAGCQFAGVTLQPDCAVLGFERQGPCVTAAQTARGPLHAGHFVIAAGSWTEPLLVPLGWRPGVRPVRGQIALLSPAKPLLRRVLMWGARYLVPRSEGLVLAGSTEEDAGFDKRTTAGAICELLALAHTLVPGLATASVERCWAGLRPGTPDGLPFLGPVPGMDNLLVAAGHFRSGIQLAPGTALLLKEHLLGQPLTVPLEPFRLDRPSAFRP